MKRSQQECPQNIEFGSLFDYLKSAWKKGWLDDYSDDHFLIKAIENRLTDFVGIDQLIANNNNMLNIVQNQKINFDAFCSIFCLNLSTKLHGLSETFGEKQIERFIRDQLSAGKNNYREDAFFEALSEISVLSFLCGANWTKCEYEPPKSQTCKKNPEAKFIYELENKKLVVNVEIKSPAFPHDNHKNDKIIIPTILLTEEGVKKIKDYCSNHDIIYLDPRVRKLCDFLNSAQSKFSNPGKDEFNLLYINWSYRDFSSNSFLEAWALLTNPLNGILTNPIYAKHFGIDDGVFSKISAIIVYTESLEGIMLQSFHHVWQGSKIGPRFCMWVNDNLYDQENETGYLKQLFEITSMNRSTNSNLMLLCDLKYHDYKSKCEAVDMGNEILRLVEFNALIIPSIAEL